MKIVLTIIVALSILGMGFREIKREKETVSILEEIINFIDFYKRELSFKACDIYELCRECEKRDFKKIEFSNGEISLIKKSYREEFGDFYEFLENIGTTDCDGQIVLCDRFLYKFKEQLKEKKSEIKSKIQINASLSILGAVSAIILFI